MNFFKQFNETILTTLYSQIDSILGAMFSFVQIKDYRRADKISAGPQSHILEGVTWEEAKKMQVI